MSNSRMRAPALVGVATVRGARGDPGPTPMRARGTKRGPTSVPAPHHILAEVSSDVGRAPSGGQLLWLGPGPNTGADLPSRRPTRAMPCRHPRPERPQGEREHSD